MPIKMKIKKSKVNKKDLSFEQPKQTILASSEQDYFRGLLMSFAFTFLTLLLLWGMENFLTLLSLDMGTSYGVIMDNMLKITGLLAVLQLLLYVLYAIINWLIKCFKEQMKKWRQ